MAETLAVLMCRKVLDNNSTSSLQVLQGKNKREKKSKLSSFRL